jgi:hypothetical protein
VEGKVGIPALSGAQVGGVFSRSFCASWAGRSGFLSDIELLFDLDTLGTGAGSAIARTEKDRLAPQVSDHVLQLGVLFEQAENPFLKLDDLLRAV